MPKQSHDPYAPLKLVCHRMFWAQIPEKPEHRSYATLLSSPHHYLILSLCKRAKTSSFKMTPPNHKVKHSGSTRIGPFVPPREAEVTIDNVPMESLLLVVRPLSPQTEKVSVVEEQGPVQTPSQG